MKVLLVDMPFDNLERPALGLSLLKARLIGDEIADCEILYANIMFASAITFGAYTMVANGSPDRSLAGDWVFADSVFERDPERSELYINHVLGGMPQDYLSALRHARDSAPAFLEDLISAVPWSDYDIVGFTSSGDQNLAAMSLARRLKERHPKLVIAAGGANWHGSMGLAHLRAFPFVDVAFLGEGEDAFAAVVQALARHEGAAGVYGVAVRGAPPADGRTATTADLDGLPVAEFDDFFEQMTAAGLDAEVQCGLSVEASRGCRWAERHPCSFCGLSGPVRRYRTKSSARVLRELRDLAARWPGRDIDIVDNMVPRTFLTEVLPDLVRRPLGARLFFESRPDLTKADVETIAASGASLQVGIESLSDHVLQLMHKGTTVLRVVRLLRLFRDSGLAPAWNIILGTPGERDQDYRDMIELLPSLRHLQPPQVCAPFSLVRFSPLFESFRGPRFRNVRPSAAYRLTYRVSDELLWGLATAFDYDEALTLDTRAYRYRLRAEVRAWQGATAAGEPHLVRSQDGRLALVDGRPPRPGSRELDELEALMLVRSEKSRSLNQLVEAARHALRGEPAPAERVKVCLTSLVAQRLMVHVGERYLSLVLPERGDPVRAGRREAARP